jgi:hypothetical protein
MLDFMPLSKRNALIQVMEESGFEPHLNTKSHNNFPDLQISERNGALVIGDVAVPIANPKNPELVPSVLFYDILSK